MMAAKSEGRRTTRKARGAVSTGDLARRAFRLAIVGAASLLLALPLSAQRGGRGGGRGGGGIDRSQLSALLGGSNDYYTPPAFHGNPPYDGRFVFARIKYSGYFAFGQEGPGWSHDYPDADEHLMRIMREITILRPFVQSGPILGGAIVSLDDPELFRYPIAYMSEPGGWYPNDKEIEGLRKYLQKGGFLIFDDLSRYHWVNGAAQMARVIPGAQFVHLTGNEPIFDSFYKIDVKQVEQQCRLPANRRNCYRGTPQFWGLYENNDPKRRLIALANVDADIGEFWQWSGTGWAGMDVSNEAFKLGINWLIYALTH